MEVFKIYISLAVVTTLFVWISIKPVNKECLKVALLDSPILVMVINQEGLVILVGLIGSDIKTSSCTSTEDHLSVMKVRILLNSSVDVTSE
ncbi:MAG: hypothetical protein ACYSUK_04420 [Planctomycetota bacterium]|jgi:hypothetical protein